MRQSRQSVNIWYKFAHLVQFLQNLAWGGSFRPEPLCQISPLSLLKCGLTAPKIAKIANFWYNFAKIYIPLKRFLPNLAWKRESQVRTLMPNFTIVALKMWAYSAQNRKKKLIFGINLPLGKFWGSVEKVEYRCTTTNLPICKDIIIVLKITPLHSVYVITNFVIRKRDQQKNKLEINMHHFPKAWHGDRGGPCHFCTPNFFSPISNFAAMGH